MERQAEVLAQAKVQPEVPVQVAAGAVTAAAVPLRLESALLAAELEQLVV